MPFGSVAFATDESSGRTRTSSTITPRCFERRDDVLQILHVQAEVVEAGTAVRVGLLQLHERVAARLDVGQRAACRAASFTVNASRKPIFCV